MVIGTGPVLISVLLVARALLPDMDVNGWPFYCRVFPCVCIGWFLTLLGLLAFHVHCLTRRKGNFRTVRFLFPEALSGTDTWRDRIFYRAIGIRGVISDAQQTLAKEGGKSPSGRSRNQP
jgi:hypothetical protein